ncbi:MAG TPA: D-2-hydroxyacid dehydrogenase [Gammaproteobacteria bacterium]|nr:D-2-hydroxyacid dehydrogenase [Gammaproteobacteria bacterium]
MSKAQALFLDRPSLYPDDLDFSALNDVAHWQDFDSASDIKHCLSETEIIVSNKVLIDAAVIGDAPRLRLICIAATGVNNVDIDVARQRGIVVCNVRAYATSSVAQHVFSLILSLGRKLFSYREAVIRGRWSQSPFFCDFEEPIHELDGKTIGIVGFGDLGQAVAKIARCFGMRILIAHSHNAESRVGESDFQAARVAMPELLAESDIISLHCPLTDDNRHLIGAEALSIMRPDAILINTARGGLIDERALLSALEDKQIAAAALDVLEEEPPSGNHPLINYHADNLIITPHVAWASQQSRQRLVNEIAKNIEAYSSAQKRNVI